MHKVLIVEDSASIGALLGGRVEEELGLGTRQVASLAEARRWLESGEENYFAALADLYLPDSSQGEIVALLRSHDVPTVVLTREMSDEVRNRIWSQDVVDYLYKESFADIGYAVGVIRRLRKNPGIRVLIVDDSATYRSWMRSILERQELQVLEAADGAKALEQLDAYPDVKLALVDYNLPGMDGFQLTARLRKRRSKDSLAIIAVSEFESKKTSSRFLKLGANDSLGKPFSTEEFLCRINLHLDGIDLMESLKEKANHDYLTGLFNRMYFFDRARRLALRNSDGSPAFGLAMLDIDHFKDVNDRYRHDAGDAALKRLAELFQENTKGKDIVARFGGEEFCILLRESDPRNTVQFFEDLRARAEGLEIHSDRGTFTITLSIGVCTAPLEDLEETLKQADRLLYRAKESGRNRVISDLPTRDPAPESPAGADLRTEPGSQPR